MLKYLFCIHFSQCLRRLQHNIKMSGVCLNDIQLAYQRIKPHVHRTPVITSQFFNKLTGRELFFKGEHLQKTGSFKARGACNCVSAGISDKSYYYSVTGDRSP